MKIFKYFKNEGANEGGGYSDASQQAFAELGDKLNMNTTSGKVDENGQGIVDNPEPEKKEEPITDPATESEKEEPATKSDELNFEKEEGEPEKKEEPATSEEEEEIYDLSELGEYESLEDIKKDLGELAELRAFKKNIEENPPKLEFENDKQKQLFEYAQKYKGNEVAAMQNFLHIQGLNLETMSEKDRIIESWNLEAEYQEMSSSERRRYLEAKFEKEYGEIDPEDVMQKTEFNLAAKKARTKLEQVQKDFMEAKAEDANHATDPDQIAKLRTDVTKSLADFDGTLEIEVNPSGKPEDKIKVNIEIASENLVEKLTEDAMNVPETWNNLLSEAGVIKDDGNYDLNKYGKLLHELQNRQVIYKQMYNQGSIDREIHLRKKYGKPSTKAENGAGGSTKSTADVKPGSKEEQELLANAIMGNI